MHDIQKRKSGLQTQALLIEKAAELMSEQGTKQVTIRDLVKVVGIRESSFYNHFESKQALIETLYEVFKTKIAGMAPTVEALDQLSKLETVGCCLQSYVKDYSQPRDPFMQQLFKLILIERFTESKAAEVYFEVCIRQSERHLEGLFRTLAIQGRIVSSSYDALAMAFNHMLIGFAEDFGVAEQGFADKKEVEDRFVRSIQVFGDAISS